MAACTFFGHRDSPDHLQPVLYGVLEELVQKGVSQFYLGRQGRFDALAHRALMELARQYPHIRLTVVLAYLPASGGKPDADTLFPDDLEFVPPRYAIDRRNRWMLAQSDYVVAYVAHPWGCAARFVRAAERMRKTIVNLALL